MAILACPLIIRVSIKLVGDVVNWLASCFLRERRQHYAVYDWDSTGIRDGIPLCEGEDVVVDDGQDDGSRWWSGSVRGISGRFPSSYIGLRPPGPPRVKWTRHMQNYDRFVERALTRLHNWRAPVGRTLNWYVQVAGLLATVALVKAGGGAVVCASVRAFVSYQPFGFVENIAHGTYDLVPKLWYPPADGSGGDDARAQNITSPDLIWEETSWYPGLIQVLALPKAAKHPEERQPRHQLGSPPETLKETSRQVRERQRRERKQVRKEEKKKAEREKKGRQKGRDTVKQKLKALATKPTPRLSSDELRKQRAMERATGRKTEKAGLPATTKLRPATAAAATLQSPCEASGFTSATFCNGRGKPTTEDDSVQRICICTDCQDNYSGKRCEVAPAATTTITTTTTTSTVHPTTTTIITNATTTSASSTAVPKVAATDQQADEADNNGL